MTDRPLVVLAGPIHPEGRANLEREARVIQCDEETEAPFVEVAAGRTGSCSARSRAARILMGLPRLKSWASRRGSRHRRLPPPRAGWRCAAPALTRSVAEPADGLLMCATRAPDRRWTREATGRPCAAQIELDADVGIVGVGNIGDGGESRRRSHALLGYDPTCRPRS